MYEDRLGKEERVQLRGVAYHVSVCGPDEAPLAIFLHGFLGAGADFATVVRACSAQLRCVSVDLPGHGRSAAPDDPGRYALSETAADFAALLDHLQSETASVVGYSLGGRSALAFAVHFPGRVRSLVLESASPGLVSPAARAARRAHDEALALRFLSFDLAGEIDAWESQPLFATQRALPALRRAAQRAVRLQQRPHGLANSLRGAGTGAQPSYWERLSRLRCPTLLVTGGQDEKFSRIAEQMAGLLPHCERAEWESAGHNVHIEQPDWFAALAGDFLRRTAATTT